MAEEYHPDTNPGRGLMTRGPKWAPGNWDDILLDGKRVGDMSQSDLDAYFAGNGSYDPSAGRECNLRRCLGNARPPLAWGATS